MSKPTEQDPRDRHFAPTVSNPTKDALSLETSPQAPGQLPFVRKGDAWESPDGRYLIQRELGHGGMGVVYQAWQKDLQRLVAIKMLSQARAMSPEDRIRFLREARAAASVVHPNVVATYDIGEWGEIPYLVMELIEGETLAERLRKKPPAVRISAELVRSLAEAVAVAHEKGIVHRDIKPGNIFLTKDAVAKLGDFGLARMKGQLTLTQSGDRVGTPLYMSPEQAQGRRSLMGPASDVYSLGATLYECLTGLPPFVGGTPDDVMAKVIRDDPVRVRRRNRVVSRDLETIVMKCLEKDPNRRYRTAREMAEDLERFARGEPVLAQPPSPTYRLQRWLSRRKAIVIPSAAAAVLSLALGGWLLQERAAKRAVELYAPLDKELALMTMQFYRKDFVLTDKEFERYRKLQEKIKQQMADSGASARGWWLIGRCREVVADYAEAGKAYDEALKIDRDHAPSLLRKGKLSIESALIEGSSPRADQERPGRAIELALEGEKWIGRGLSAISGASGKADAGENPGMEADLASAYLAVVRGSSQARYSAQVMLSKWKGAPLVEEFLLLEAISHGNAV